MNKEENITLISCSIKDCDNLITVKRLKANTKWEVHEVTSELIRRPELLVTCGLHNKELLYEYFLKHKWFSIRALNKEDF